MRLLVIGEILWEDVCEVLFIMLGLRVCAGHDGVFHRPDLLGYDVVQVWVRDEFAEYGGGDESCGVGVVVQDFQDVCDRDVVCVRSPRVVVRRGRDKGVA